MRRLFAALRAASPIFFLGEDPRKDVHYLHRGSWTVREPSLRGHFWEKIADRHAESERE